MLALEHVRATSTGESNVEETLTDDAMGRQFVAAEVSAPHLFVALECSRPEAGATRHSLANVDRVVVRRGRARTAERFVSQGVRTLELRIPDSYLSTDHAWMTRHGSGFLLEDRGSRNGTRVRGALVTEPGPLVDGDLVLAGHTLLRFRAELTAPLGEPADVDSGSDDGAVPVTTIDPSLSRRARTLARVAKAESSVLLLGETGTGKEVVARAVHRLSGRTGRFVAVNCGAIPGALVEAQLFGHVRGAFSGATGDAEGLIRSAHRGTLLLDEIGDLPASAQVALLRVLQEREVLPIGATQPSKVDFRVIAATHRPLEQLVARGDFRSDLFARISAFTFEIPPLRARPEDVGPLIAAFAKTRPFALTHRAGQALLEYEWPLNVRELNDLLGVSLAIAGGDMIDVAHLPDRVTSRTTKQRTVSPADPSGELRDVLTASLARHSGNISAVARDLGKARMQVQRWMRRFGIDARSFHP
jgi:pSer/pThr/pTyr-binding forkhead associated (FHA) protein